MRKAKWWKWLAMGAVMLAAISAAVVWTVSEKNVKEYKQTEESFGNPLMGYAPCAWYDEIREDVSLLYMDITWAELEPEEGQYD